MSVIQPSEFLNHLARFDVCIESGKLYRSIPNSSFATDPMQKRMTYWFIEFRKHDLNQYSIEFLIGCYRLEFYEGKTIYRFLFDNYDKVRDIGYKYVSYNQNIMVTFMDDLMVYARKPRAWDFDKGIDSTFYKSLLMGEFCNEFYIILNHLMDITSYWKDTKVPLMKDIIKFLDNSMEILYYTFKQFNVGAIVNSDEFFDKAESIIHGE